MNDSSDDILRGVGPKQIRVFLDILRDHTWRARTFVEDRFRERAHNFAGTLAFLQQLGWVRNDGPVLQIAGAWIDRFSDESADGYGVALLDALLNSPGRHQACFARYLLRFQSINGVVVRSAIGNFDFAETAARDFLMEIGAVHHETSRKEYVLLRRFFGAYVWALGRRGPDTHAELMENLAGRHQFGHQAELAIVSFERQRLGDRWADQIYHVADEHPTSPFDIKSLTLNEGRPSPRYIEVKAVSAAEPEFYWSAAEIEAARLLQGEYYLYLLPVSGPGDLDVAQLQMIADPYAEIFSQPSTWEKLPTSFLCRPVKI